MNSETAPGISDISGRVGLQDACPTRCKLVVHQEFLFSSQSLTVTQLAMSANNFLIGKLVSQAI